MSPQDGRRFGMSAALTYDKVGKELPRLRLELQLGIFSVQLIRLTHFFVKAIVRNE